MAQEYISILNGKLIKDKEARQYIGDINNLKTDDSNTNIVSAINEIKNNIHNIDVVHLSSTATDLQAASAKSTYDEIQTVKTLGLKSAKIDQVISIKEVNSDGAPTSYSTINPISDTELNDVIIEILDSVTIKQNASTLILNSSTQDSTKQFEITIDDTGTITAQEL